MQASNDDRRHRLLAVAKVLRQFSLTDEFDLGELVLSKSSPSRGDVEKRLKNGRVLLPSGISAGFLADCVISGIQEADVTVFGGKSSILHNARNDLAAIPTGAAHAGRFHTKILALLEAIFDQHLGTLQKEKPLLSGLKRLDIKADNDKQNGFFANLRTHYGLHAPYVFCECKNYAEDPKNPEFDQLLGRLNRTTTVVGLLICRSLTDKLRVLQRCREPFAREGKLVIVLSDDDIVRLSELRLNNDAAGLDAFLRRKLEEVTL